jgi:hypothetical protein
VYKEKLVNVERKKMLLNNQKRVYVEMKEVILVREKLNLQRERK